MIGPFPVVGDCVSDEERMSMAFIEYTSTLASGDLGIWYMPSLEPGEQYASKWLLIDQSGKSWLACKYFAVRYRPGFHVPIAKVVLIISSGLGSLDPELSDRMSSEIRDLRANPPKRADLVVFESDLLEHQQIITAIEEHRRHWVS